MDEINNRSKYSNRNLPRLAKKRSDISSRTDLEYVELRTTAKIPTRGLFGDIWRNTLWRSAANNKRRTKIKIPIPYKNSERRKDYVCEEIDYKI